MIDHIQSLNQNQVEGANEEQHWKAVIVPIGILWKNCEIKSQKIRQSLMWLG